VIRPLPTASKLAMVTLLICGIFVLPGCGREEARKEVDFNFALPASWQIVNISRLDTNDDQENEWVILYTFDMPGIKTFSPIRCAIYHIARREPKLPIIYPYHLQAPSWTYLGEGGDRTGVQVEDVVTTIQLDPSRIYASPHEIVVRSKDADGFVTRASIFQWRDNVQNKLIDPREVIVVGTDSLESGQWYQCVGFFEGSSIAIEQDKVTVQSRTNDRSQFAQIKIYKPTSGPGGYLDENDQLVSPVSSCLDFAYGMPDNLLQSPYPEKIVMAFHKQYTDAARNYGEAFLTQDAQEQRKKSADWDIFGRDTSGACVTQISYNPESETQSEIQVFDQGSGHATTVVETWGEYHLAGGSVRKKIDWEMVRDDNVWRIQGIRSIRDIQ
jgi:hypothetical protein